MFSIEHSRLHLQAEFLRRTLISLFPRLYLGLLWLFLVSYWTALSYLHLLSYNKIKQAVSDFASLRPLCFQLRVCLLRTCLCLNMLQFLPSLHCTGVLIWFLNSGTSSSTSGWVAVPSGGSPVVDPWQPDLMSVSLYWVQSSISLLLWTFSIWI